MIRPVLMDEYEGLYIRFDDVKRKLGDFEKRVKKLEEEDPPDPPDPPQPTEYAAFASYNRHELGDTFTGYAIGVADRWVKYDYSWHDGGSVLEECNAYQLVSAPKFVFYADTRPDIHCVEPKTGSTASSGCMESGTKYLDVLREYKRLYPARYENYYSGTIDPNMIAWSASAWDIFDSDGNMYCSRDKYPFPWDDAPEALYSSLLWCVPVILTPNVPGHTNAYDTWRSGDTEPRSYIRFSQDQYTFSANRYPVEITGGELIMNYESKDPRVGGFELPTYCQSSKGTQREFSYLFNNWVPSERRPSGMSSGTLTVSFHTPCLIRLPDKDTLITFSGVKVAREDTNFNMGNPQISAGTGKTVDALPVSYFDPISMSCYEE